MKLLAAVGVYLGVGIVIACGIVLAVKGSPWLLVASTLGFLIAFARIGCLEH
jgi:hypothetical protein